MLAKISSSSILMRRWTLHETFIKVFTKPGWKRAIYALRAWELETRVFMVQLMYQAALQAAKVIDSVTKDEVLKTKEPDLIANAYQSRRIPETGTWRNRHWSPPDPTRGPEALLEDVVSVAVSKLLLVSCQIRTDLDASDDMWRNFMRIKKE